MSEASNTIKALEQRAAVNADTIETLLEQIACLEQRAANRDLILERILIWLKSDDVAFSDQGREFIAGIEKHLAILEEVEEGEKKSVHLEDGVQLNDQR